ncbi:MAG: C4-dicarboxylate transporter DcuC, partial [Propionibacteriaceae bacterium]
MVMNIALVLFAVIITGYLIIRKYCAQTVLLFFGMLMMLGAHFLVHYNVPKESQTGWFGFDLFNMVDATLIKNVSDLGLQIMACMGFAKYMDHIGASSRMVQLALKPLKALKGPYVVMAIVFVLNMAMSLVIPSASGLAMLMMVVVFPILTSLGVSKLGAASAVACGHLLDFGPASATTLLVAKTVKMPVNEYFAKYQVPVYIICAAFAAIAMALWQWHLDRKEAATALVVTETVAVAGAENAKKAIANMGPIYYVLLPFIPIVLLMVFSDYGIKSIKLGVDVAMFVGLAIAMVFELIHTRNVREVSDSIKVFFKAMGTQFANTVTLIAAGQIFAIGITSLGVVTQLANWLKGTSISPSVIMIGVSLLIVVLSIVMGSSVASMTAFTPLIPTFAASVGLVPVTTLLMMQNAGSLGRLLSPISAVIIAVALVGEVSPVDLVKRNSVPVLVALLASTISILVI